MSVMFLEELHMDNIISEHCGLSSSALFSVILECLYRGSMDRDSQYKHLGMTFFTARLGTL